MNIVKYNNINIYEEVYDDVSQLLQEEYGVARFVYSLTAKVIKQLHNNIENNKNLFIKRKLKGINEISTKIPINVGEYKVIVNIIINSFDNEDTFKEYVKGFTIGGGSSDLELQSLTAYTYAVEYNINFRSLYNTLQHENSHLYDAFMADRDNKQPMNNKYLDLYSKITELYSNKISSEERKILLGLYMWFQTEQTASANGLDAELTYFGDSYKKSYIVYNSETWKMLENIKWCLENDKHYQDFIVGKIGFTYEKYHKMIEEAYHDFSRRIARVCHKHSMSQRINEGAMINILSFDNEKYTLI